MCPRPDGARLWQDLCEIALAESCVELLHACLRVSLAEVEFRQNDRIIVGKLAAIGLLVGALSIACEPEERHQGEVSEDDSAEITTATTSTSIETTSSSSTIDSTVEGPAKWDGFVWDEGNWGGRQNASQ